MDEMRADNEGMGMAVRGGELPPVSPLVRLAQSKISGKTLTPADVGASPSPFQTRAAPGIQQQPMAEPVPEAVPEPAPAPSPMSEQRQRIASQIATEEARRAAERQTMAQMEQLHRQRESLSSAINEASQARATGSGPLMTLEPYSNVPLGVLGGGSAAALALKYGTDEAKRAQQQQATGAPHQAGSSDSNSQPNQQIARADVDEGHLDPRLFGVQRPMAEMDRSNTLGVDETSAYPAGAVHNYDRGNALGVDEVSAYPAGAIHNYNRNNAPGVNELGAYAKPTVQLAKQQTASRMPDVIDLNTKPAVNRGQPIDLTSNASAGPGFFSRMFSGPAYQSTGNKVVGDNGKVDWGSSDSAADFVRADRAAMAQRAQQPSDDDNRARGGAVNASPTKEALLHKSLEIIHHMIRSR
jgi:hypothetical protein